MVKNINWNLRMFNPTDKTVIHSTTYNNIEEIHKEHPYITLPTWRNIAIGRSKIYKNFIEIEKTNKSITPTSIDEPLDLEEVNIN